MESCDFAGGWVSLLPRGSLIGQQSSPPLPGLSDWAADKDSEAAHPFPAKCSHMSSGHLKNYPTHGQLGKWASKTHSHQRGDRPCAKYVLAAFHVVRVTAWEAGMSTLSKGETHAEVELVRGGIRILTQAGESSNYCIEGPSISSTVLTLALLHIDRLSQLYGR